MNATDQLDVERDDRSEEEALGRVVSLLREARGLSREQLSQVTADLVANEMADLTGAARIKGVSPSTVAKLEQGAKAPRPRTLALLARALGVTTTELYERADVLATSGRVNLQAARRIALGKVTNRGGVGALAGGAIGGALGGYLAGAGGAAIGAKHGAELGKILFAVEERLGRPLREEDLEVLKALSEVSGADMPTDE